MSQTLHVIVARHGERLDDDERRLGELERDMRDVRDMVTRLSVRMGIYAALGSFVATLVSGIALIAVTRLTGGTP